jgi:signal transduction histidine kinase
VSSSSVAHDDLVTIPAPEPGPVLTAATLSKFGHQLRGPLGGIIGLTRLMSRKIAQGAVDPAQQSHQLDMLLASAGELLATSERAVELLRIEQSGDHTGQDTFDCRSVVAHTVAELTDAAQIRRRRLHIDLPDEPVPAVGAIDGAGQAMAELLSNAIKYSDQADVHLAARTVAGFALIEVRDAGPGLTTQDQQDAFEPFQRGSAAHATNEPGSGLGLCLAQHLASRSGATLSVTTSPRGTTCTLTFAAPAAARPTDRGRAAS